MKRVSLGLILFFVFTLHGIYGADNRGKITGKVIDSQSKEPLEFVNVTLRKQGSTQFLNYGTTTDQNGNFSLSNLPFDKYTVVVSFIGYNAFEQDIVLSSGLTEVNLRQVPLTEDSNLLDEVQVIGVRSQMRLDIDKKVFNVDQDISSTGGSASDILGNIPSVEVDNEGEVSLRGNSSVTIWINGKASGLTADNRAQILEQLPAETIEKIEVITNPSAKFSPEGTAGIINIVLKRDRKAGYYGSAQAGVNTYGAMNASANINYNSSRLDAFAGVGFRQRKRRSGGYTDRLNLSDADTTFLNSDNKTRGNNDNIFTRLGLTYHLTPKDHLSVNAFGMFGNGNSKTTTNYTSNDPGSFTSSQRIARSDDNMTGGNVEIGYKREFTEDHYLDFTTSFNKWGMDNTSIYEQMSLFATEQTSTSYQRQERDINNRNWEIQLDYYNKLNDKHRIEAGYKGTLGKENSPIETYSGTHEEAVTPDEGLFNRFIYNKDIHALYGTYSGKVSKLSYQLGLRGEYSHISTRSPGYKQQPSDVEPYKDNYFSIFPSVFLSYSLPNENEFQLNYTRRISRPWGGQLNPFMNVTDSTSISYGNPYLNPQYSNAFELNYLKTWEMHMISFSGYYRSTDDVIQRISYLDGNVMKSTYENITQTQSAGTEIIVKNQFARFLDLTTTLNLFYYKLDGFSYIVPETSQVITGEGQDDFSWNVRMIANFKLPKSYNFQLTGNYNAKQVVAQGYRKANYSLDGGIRKSFNKFSVSLSARDILDSRKRATVTSGTGFSQVSESWWGGRQANLTVTYSFGNMNPKRGNNRQNNIDGNSYNADGAEY